MPGEETTNITQVSNADTSSEATVSQNTDNSQGDEINLSEEISKALDEPDNDVTGDDEEQDKEPTVKTQDNSNLNCPDKFKNEDGSTNVENLLKSYKELEKLIPQKSEWDKERAELAKFREEAAKAQQNKEEAAIQQGYESALDMEQHLALVNVEANEYAKYLNYTDDPEAVRQMLINYINNPSQDLLDDIEVEFAPEIIKRVAIAKDRQAQQFAKEAEERTYTQNITNIEGVISQAVNTHKELFDYEPFKNLFINTLKKYGDTFSNEDASMLMDTVLQLKELWATEQTKALGAKKENTEATDKLSAISTSNSAPNVNLNADIDKMSDKELSSYIRKFI